MFDSIDDMLNGYEEWQKKKTYNRTKMFNDSLRKQFENDREGVSKIYTRDKTKFNIKVCSLKNGGYGIADKDKNIIYKNDDLHLCKVEWIMRTNTI